MPESSAETAPTLTPLWHLLDALQGEPDDARAALGYQHLLDELAALRAEVRRARIRRIRALVVRHPRAEVSAMLGISRQRLSQIENDEP